MVAASIAALRLNVRNSAIFNDDLLDECGEFLVDEVGNDAHAFRLASVKCTLDVTSLFACG